MWRMFRGRREISGQAGVSAEGGCLTPWGLRPCRLLGASMVTHEVKAGELWEGLKRSELHPPCACECLTFSRSVKPFLGFLWVPVLFRTPFSVILLLFRRLGLQVSVQPPAGLNNNLPPFSYLFIFLLYPAFSSDRFLCGGDVWVSLPSWHCIVQSTGVTEIAQRYVEPQPGWDATRHIWYF